MRSVLSAIALVLNLGYGNGPGSATQQVAPPDLQGFPTSPAPDALGTVTLPDTVDAVKALFERLPADVAGQVRSPQFDRTAPDRTSVSYGEDSRMSGMRSGLLSLEAIDLSKGDFFPTNWTGGQVVAFMARGDAVKEAGRDGDLFWIRLDTFREAFGSPERLAVYGMLWGRVDSTWMFSIQADARENRDALLAAFVAAAMSSPR